MRIVSGNHQVFLKKRAQLEEPANGSSRTQPGMPVTAGISRQRWYRSYPQEPSSIRDYFHE